MRCPRILPLAAGLAFGCVACEQSTGPPAEPPPDPVPPVIRSFGPLSPSVYHGDATNLVWRVDGATVASISGIGVVTPPTEGSFNIRPHVTVSYTLMASNAYGTVQATATVEVQYLAAIFVNAVGGDDAASGSTPATALKTLDAALGRVQGGGFIYLSAGLYRNAVVIDGIQVGFHGGLDPVTFFEVPGSTLRTTIQPVAGIPLTVRNTGPAIVEMTNLTFDTRGTGGGPLVALVDGATVRFHDCTLDGKTATEATAIRIAGTSDVDLLRCRIWGGNPAQGAPLLESRAVQILDASRVRLLSCFVDGGRAQEVCSGIDVATSGSVRVGLCTIAAEITTSGATNSAAAIRIRQGHPLIGGNILFTRGSGRRLGVSEEAVDTDPAFLESNLFVSVGTPPYNNFGPNDPLDQAGLNDPTRTLETQPNNVYANVLETSIGAHQLFPQGGSANGEFHLVQPLLDGAANPAVDALPY
ncbi:MAG: hypothetical protein ACRDGR_09390, partial [bacterium]